MRALSILFLLALCAPANAQEKCDPDYLVTHGLFFYGSVECNHKWFDRPALSIARDFAKMCETHMTMGEMGKHIKRGMDSFDASVKTLGHDAACKKLDESMEEVENAE